MNIDRNLCKPPILAEGDQTTKWRSWRINRAFIENLYGAYPQGFTNADAYKVYVANHWTGREHAISIADHARDTFAEGNIIEPIYRRNAEQGDDWMKMNVRNHLSAAAYRGILIRIKPGVYRWAQI